MLLIQDIVESTRALLIITNIGLNMVGFVNFEMVVALSPFQVNEIMVNWTVGKKVKGLNQM